MSFIEQHLTNPTASQDKILQVISEKCPKELDACLQEVSLRQLSIISQNNKNPELQDKILERAKQNTSFISWVKSIFSEEAATKYKDSKAIIDNILSAKNDTVQHQQSPQISSTEKKIHISEVAPDLKEQASVIVGDAKKGLETGDKFQSREKKQRTSPSQSAGAHSFRS